MNEPTVSDERLKEIEARATYKIYPIEDHVPTVMDSLYGSDSPDISSMARELLARREVDLWAKEHDVWVAPGGLGYRVRKGTFNVEYEFERSHGTNCGYFPDAFTALQTYREWHSRREADHLTEIAQRVPSDADLRLLAEKGDKRC